MIDTEHFASLSDAEAAEILGGEGWVVFVLKYLWNNAGEFAAGIKEGYARGGSPSP